MKKGFSYFDRVLLINLDKRVDRLKRCEAIFEEFEVSDIIQRYPAQIPTQEDYLDYINDGKTIKLGEYGCTVSHVNIIKMAKANNWKSVLVLEDDIKFINTKYIDASIEQLQEEEWNLFYLGTNARIPLSKVNDNLLELKRGYATHAVAYHERFYDTVISAFDKKEINIIDVWLSNHGQLKTKCYCSFPITAVQEVSFSDIHHCVVDYSWMEKTFNEMTKHLYPLK
jgi:glycosyl transferase family 25